MRNYDNYDTYCSECGWLGNRDSIETTSREDWGNILVCPNCGSSYLCETELCDCGCRHIPDDIMHIHTRWGEHFRFGACCFDTDVLTFEPEQVPMRDNFGRYSIMSKFVARPFKNVEVCVSVVENNTLLKPGTQEFIINVRNTGFITMSEFNEGIDNDNEPTSMVDIDIIMDYVGRYAKELDEMYNGVQHDSYRWLDKVKE